MIEKLEQKLNELVAKRNKTRLGSQEWRIAVADIEDLRATTREIELKNAPKPDPMPEWEAAQLDQDWDEDW